MKTVFGPVSSWRFGRSVGVDPLCRNACSFDCIYCQVGPTLDKTIQNDVFISTDRIKEDLKRILPGVSADIVTISGYGEPTLAENLDEIIEAVKEVTDLPVAILTNSSTLSLGKMRRILNEMDVVVAKLDAPDESLFEEINRPVKGLHFGNILKWIKKFKSSFNGRLELQTMFIEKNKDYAGELAKIAAEIQPDSVYINTPLRHSLEGHLSEGQMSEIEGYFEGLNVSSVYNSKKYRSYKEMLKRRSIEG
ncbi:radical SAM protein [Methanobacterium sp. MBAC-LM]|uniref:radical SAM protein n=1 Tax=Methanobacterium sp. MBAC-LM TaxID=3412034 RepID=UPI003C77F834